MVKYAKLENQTLIAAPTALPGEASLIINPTADTLLAVGYLPVQYTDPPAAADGYYAVPRWTQTETAIVQEWDIVKDTRPLTESAVTRLLIAQQINTMEVDDNTALRMVEFYPEWESGKAYTAANGCTAGYKVTRNGKLWKLLQEHTSQADWAPGEIGTESLWEEICESHAGTKDDPIPYNGNMALGNGKYYTQDGVLYLCNRDTINPVYNPLAELVGVYVTVVEVN